MDMPGLSTSSNRILYDVPCAVCRDHSSGKHYGVFACDGCAGFFKRSVRRDRGYTCKARFPGACLIDKVHRNQCRACRLAKCLDVGMNKDSVQHERGPRNSTIRRQMALFFKSSSSSTSNNRPTVASPLNLALNKQNVLAPLPLGLYPTPYYTRLRFISPPILQNVDGTNFEVTSMTVASETDALCESAARILFMNVKWAKSIPAFTTLSLSDRLLLLVESWRDLFVLATVQFLYPLNIRLLLDLNNTSDEISRGVELFESAMSVMSKAQPDINEFSCLRGLMVFKTCFDDREAGSSSQDSEPKRLQDIATVAALKDHSQSILCEYAALTYPLDTARVAQIYQLLQVVKLVPSNTIVELFFRPTIGATSIEKIICDMYMSERDAI